MRRQKPKQEYLSESDDDSPRSYSYTPYHYVSPQEKREALRGTISALAGSLKVKIELTDDDETPHADVSSDTIKVGTGDIWKYSNTDRYIGIALHEVGHIKHSPPRGNTVPPKHADIHNLLEDARIDTLMGGEYAGGEYYLAELYDPILGAISSAVAVEPSETVISIPEALNHACEVEPIELEAAMQTLKGSGDYDTDVHKALPSLKDTLLQKKKTELFNRVLSMAVLEAHDILPFGATSSVLELDKCITPIAGIIRQAKTANAAEVPVLTQKLARMIQDIIPEPTEDGTSRRTIEQLASNGADAGDSGHHTPSQHNYTKGDERGRARVAQVRKKILMYLRDNDHARFHGGKRKGLLDKRGLSRIARDNYRVYRKREDTKAKEYAVSIVVDTSSSMFGHIKYNNPLQVIDVALESVSILARSFRALGFPSAVVGCGTAAKTVLDFRERYLPHTIEKKLESGERTGAWQGGTELVIGVREALRRLVPVSGARHKLLVMITDGAVSSGDVIRIQEMLHRQRNMTTIVYYIGGHNVSQIVEPEREIVIEDASDLPEATVKLLRHIVLT